MRKLAAVALGLVMLTACTTTTAGQPHPAETVSQPSETSAERSTSETKAPEYSLVHLCELLSPEEAQSLGGSPEGEEKNSASDGHTICGWSDETYLVVGFQNGLTIANADAGPGITNTPTTIDGLPAVQSLQTDTVVICEVMVELPTGRLFTSSVTVLSAGEGKYDPCQVAIQLSNLIIPRVRNQ